ncbi:dihydroneopterin aldolase [Crocinitomicaceae bacterium]|nr:dihydroneopterin aldolase [Crocinitomicaceae bacterium]
MKHNISVEGIKIYAFHGCLEEEERIGGHYIVDVFIETDFSKGALEDNLEHTIDYVWVNNIVKEEMSIRSKLIETVGQRIMVRLKSKGFNAKYKLIIRKLTPPINGDVASVSISIDEF